MASDHAGPWAHPISEVRGQAADPVPLLRRLGIVGMDRQEPVIIAALASEAPLLLIGPHGSAKSMLLERLAEALGLERRHYNASLLNYDDLVGYPLPDGDGRLRFVETPASIWQAQAVFLDEISRCRPDMQNRLFSIIHEKRIQGMALQRLVYRWAAMNPPAPEDGERNGETYYAGSEPLDAALADRFPFVVEVPPWAALDERDRDAIIRSTAGPVAEADATALRQAVAAARAGIAGVQADFGPTIVEYVRLIFDHLRQMELHLSGRRAAMLYRNVIAVHAVRLTGTPAAAPADSAWLALECAIPQRAQGSRLDLARMLLAHNEAWKAADLNRADPRRLLVAEPDPVRRAVKALSLLSLSTQEVSAHVADGLAHVGPGARHALALHVIGSPAAERLVAAVAEQVAALSGVALAAQSVETRVVAAGIQHKVWERVLWTLAQFAQDDPEGVLLGNVLAKLFAGGELHCIEHVQRAVEGWTTVRLLCHNSARSA